MTFTLDSITTGADHSPPRIIFYSPEGFGKTTWAAAAPKPIFIPTEKGQGKLTYAKFPQVQSFEDVMSALRTLYREKHDYQTVVLDTLSRLEQLVHAEIRQKKGEDIFTNYGKGFKLVPAYFERLIKALNSIQEKGMMVIVLGHASIKRMEPPDNSPYDVYALNVHEFIRDMMFQWCDVMLFGNYKVLTKEQDVGFNQTRSVAVGDAGRFVYSEERPTHKAKNRLGLPPTFPLELPFNWDGFLKAMGKSPPWTKAGAEEKEKEPTEAEVAAAAVANGQSEEG